jgi:pilus assembly protein CpaC
VNSKRRCVDPILAQESGKAELGKGINLLLVGMAVFAFAAPLYGQAVTVGETVQPLDMAVGRSIPMSTRGPIERVSVANPQVADVVIITERELVVNALASGTTDLLIWQTDGPTSHFRVLVHSPTDRKQVLLEVVMAEVDKTLLREVGLSFLWQDQHWRAGTGAFATDGPTPEGDVPLFNSGQFGTLLNANDIDNFYGLLEADEQSGRFKVLARPNNIAANGEEASFLAGGEVPIPVAQPGAAGVATISIEYKEFGIKLAFEPEILSDELVKLTVAPEVSSLDFGNAITIQGFEIPALRTRRATTTLDMLEGQTLAIAGLMQDITDKVVTGLPFLKDIPILGLLFSSQRYQTQQTELLILVTPHVVDPNSPPAPPPLPGEEQD